MNRTTTTRPTKATNPKVSNPVHSPAPTASARVLVAAAAVAGASAFEGKPTEQQIR